MGEKVLLDTNVLVDVVNNSKAGSTLIKTLRKTKLKFTRFVNVFMSYIQLKGTTKDFGKNNPLKRFLDVEVNDIAQQLFKQDPSVDTLGNTYYWYNLSEEWAYDSDLKKRYELIQKYLNPSEKEEALKKLETQRKFLLWKSKIKKAMHEIERIIMENEIKVCEYFQISLRSGIKERVSLLNRNLQ